MSISSLRVLITGYTRKAGLKIVKSFWLLNVVENQPPQTTPPQTSNQQVLENKLTAGKLVQLSCQVAVVVSPRPSRGQCRAGTAQQTPTEDSEQAAEGEHRRAHAQNHSLHTTPRMEIIRFHYSSQRARPVLF